MAENEVPNINKEESKSEKQDKALRRVIVGKNDLFEKHYDFSDIHPDFVFDIKIKYPSFIESGRIISTYESYLNGLGSYVDQYTHAVFMGKSVLKVCGKDVPEMFKDDDKPCNTDILARIQEDFATWADTFCG